MSQKDIRLAALESRIAIIEEKLNIKIGNTSPSHSPSPINNEHSPQAPMLAPPNNDSSGNWLGAIAVLCFILAAVFIIKLSVGSGWLTPARQLGIVSLFGISLIFGGLRLISLDEGYASLLPGAGIIILYMTVFAANRIYPFISFEIAILLMSIISGFCIYLYNFVRHDVYPLTAAVGVYAIPTLLLANVDTNILPFFMQIFTFTNITADTFHYTLYYYVACSIIFTVLSVWMRSRILLLVSAYLAILLTGNFHYIMQQDYGLVAALLPLHFFIFSIGTYSYTKRYGEPLTENASWSLFPVLLIFYALEYQFLNILHPGCAPWLSLAFAAFLLLLYTAAKQISKSPLKNSGLMLFSFIALVCFHSGYFELMPVEAGSWYLVGILIGLSLAAMRVKDRVINKILIPILLLLLAIACIEYFKIIAALIFTSQKVNPAILLSVAGIWSLFLCLPDNYKNYRYTILASAHLLVVTICYHLADPSGSLAVSTLWLTYAVAIIIWAFLRKDRVMANSATFVLIFVAGKALLYDAASTPTLVRILCLLLTGAVLYGTGFLLRKIQDWK